MRIKEVSEFEFTISDPSWFLVWVLFQVGLHKFGGFARLLMS